MPSDNSEAQKRYSQRKKTAAAEIGPCPPIKAPSRREACRLDLFRFLTTYFPASTGLLPFSDDHRRVIERMQRCIMHGGRFVNAVYRGFAKTTISENAAIWAALYGHRRFVAIFGATADAAGNNIDSIKVELAQSEQLYEDFPEVCHPIRKLEGKPQRCASQTCAGQLTHMEWTADAVVLPQIPGSVASGAVLTAHGLTAAARGMTHKRTDGTQARPDFVLVDDPQTDEVAGSPPQVAKRLGTLRKSVLKLGGHAQQIACVMNATVISPEDLVEQLLDAKRNPAWQGERIKMVKRWADAHETLWLGEYQRLRNTYDADTIGDQRRAHADATAFYTRSRLEMDRGCIVSWEHCYDHEAELSAVQHAYNLLIDDGPEVFASECQNEPMIPREFRNQLSPAQVASKVSGLARGVVPLECQHLTGFVDVQGEVLFWLVAAWAPNFTGTVIDYGTFPEQPAGYFTLAKARRKLSDAFPGAGFEGRISAGLESLMDLLMGRVWSREADGAPMHVDRCLVDANWGRSRNTVYAFCRRSKHAARLMPSHGKYVGAASLPWEEYTAKDGAQVGYHWMVPGMRDKPGATRHVLMDVNFWKSFVQDRFAVARGDRGSLTLFGSTAEQHRMLADHIDAEYRVETQGRGRKVDEWKIRPAKPDNHWLDCLCGAAAAASMLGVSLDEVRQDRARKRVKFSDLQRARRGAEA